MKDKCFSLFGRTLNQCREWAFYIFGFVLLQAVLIWLWQSHGPSEYIAHSRKFGTFGIAVAVAYKTIVLTVLIVTHPKTALDRRFIWHLGSMDALLIYALIVNFFPEWAGLPPLIPSTPNSWT